MHSVFGKKKKKKHLRICDLITNEEEGAIACKWYPEGEVTFSPVVQFTWSEPKNQNNTVLPFRSTLSRVHTDESKMNR